MASIGHCDQGIRDIRKQDVYVGPAPTGSAAALATLAAPTALTPVSVIGQRFGQVLGSMRLRKKWLLVHPTRVRGCES